MDSSGCNFAYNGPVSVPTQIISTASIWCFSATHAHKYANTPVTLNLYIFNKMFKIWDLALETITRCKEICTVIHPSWWVCVRQWNLVKGNCRKHLFSEKGERRGGERGKACPIGSAEQTFVFNYISDSSNNNCVASGTSSSQLWKWFSTFNRKGNRGVNQQFWLSSLSFSHKTNTRTRI